MLWSDDFRILLRYLHVTFLIYFPRVSAGLIILQDYGFPLRIIPAPFYISIRTIWLFLAPWFFLVRIGLHVVSCIIRMPHGKRTVYWPNARIKWHFIDILIRTSPVKRAIYGPIVRIKQHIKSIFIRILIKSLKYDPSYVLQTSPVSFFRGFGSSPEFYLF